MLLEVQADVEQRCPEQSVVVKQEGDEQAAHPAVAVEEWMDRLELDVGQPGADQGGQLGTRLVQEALQV